MAITKFLGATEFPITLTAASQLQKNRLVKRTGLVPSYATPGTAVYGRTVELGNEFDFAVAVQPLESVNGTFLLSLAGTVAAGNPLFPAATLGKVKTANGTAVNRSAADRPSPGANAVYIVPAAGWATGGATAGQIATYTHVGTSWAYADAVAGDTYYVTQEGIYLTHNGSSWVDAKVIAYALEAGVSGDDVICLVDNSTRKLGKEDFTSELLPREIQVCVGKSASENEADASVVVSDGRILAGDIALCTIQAQAGTAYIVKSVCTAKTLTVTLSANGGAGTVIGYKIFRTLDV
jgi:hypothetical protein